MGFPGGSNGKEPMCPCRRCMQVWSLRQEDPLEEGMAIHSSILAWRIPCTEESGGLQSTGVAKSRTRLSLHANYLRQIYWSKGSSSLGLCLRGPSSKEQLLPIHKAGKNERIWRQLVSSFLFKARLKRLSRESREREGIPPPPSGKVPRWILN